MGRPDPFSIGQDCRNPHVSRLMEEANDVEKNPGPPKVVKNGMMPSTTNSSRNIQNGKSLPQAKAAIGESLGESSTKPASTVPETALPNGGNGNNRAVAGSNNLDDLKLIVERQAEVIRTQRAEMEVLRKQMESYSQVQQDFQAELSEIRKNWQSISGGAGESKKVSAGGGGGGEEPGGGGGEANSSGNDPSGPSGSAGGGGHAAANNVLNKLELLASAYNDIQDRLYEIDKSWKNNLMIYGVAYAETEEDDPVITEEKVKDVLVKKLHITRDIPMNRVQRISYGPDFRGHKPIQVCIVHYRDKEEILRKARLLRGSNIYVSEDFSRKVREHRNELYKFMKEVKSRDPNRKMTLRYDKLYIGNDVFFVNDRTRRVERFHQSLDQERPGYANSFNCFNDFHARDHDSTWLRRPRSRMGVPNSRCTTPLSRQNSMTALDEFGSSTSLRSLGRTASSSNISSSARLLPSSSSSSRSKSGGTSSTAGSPRKSVSIESALQHRRHFPSDKNSGNVFLNYEPEYEEVVVDSSLMSSSPGSATSSPSKRVVFRGIMAPAAAMMDRNRAGGGGGGSLMVAKARLHRAQGHQLQVQANYPVVVPTSTDLAVALSGMADADAEDDEDELLAIEGPQGQLAITDASCGGGGGGGGGVRNLPALTHVFEAADSGGALDLGNGSTQHLKATHQVMVGPLLPPIVDYVPMASPMPNPSQQPFPMYKQMVGQHQDQQHLQQLQQQQQFQQYLLEQQLRHQRVVADHRSSSRGAATKAGSVVKPLPALVHHQYPQQQQQNGSSNGKVDLQQDPKVGAGDEAQQGLGRLSEAEEAPRVPSSEDNPHHHPHQITSKVQTEGNVVKVAVYGEFKVPANGVQ